MPCEPLLGYFLFALLLFLPGATILELFHISRERSLIENLALAFGASMGINVAVYECYFVVASYLQPVPAMEAWVPYAILGASALALSFSSSRSRPAILKRPDRYETICLVSVAFLAGFLFLLFQKYPIFPEFDSADFFIHLQYVSNVLSFTTVTPLSTVLYYGVHFNLAFAYLLNGGDILVVTRVGMAILVLLSPLLVYAATEDLFESKRAALISTLVYVGAGYIWFASVFDAGLYANFYGIIASLSLIVAFKHFLNTDERPGGWLVLLLAVVNAYFSHYSTLALAIPLLALPFLFRIKEKAMLRRVSLGVSTFLVPGIVGVLAFPQFALSVLSVSYSLGPGGITLGTPLSDLLGSVPQVQYIVAIVNQDVAAVLTLSLAVAGSVFALRRNSFASVPVIWALAMIAATPPNGNAWRFGYMTLVPLTLLASLGLDKLISSLDTSGLLSSGSPKRRRRAGAALPRRTKSTAVVIALFFLLLVVWGSWTATSIRDVTSDVRVYSSAQVDLYNSMVWFAQNTPPQSTLLSVTDWRINCLEPLTGRSGSLLMYANATQALSYAKANGFGYVLVTYLIPENVPAGFDAVSYYNSFSTSASLKEVYSNPTDIIYQVVA